MQSKRPLIIVSIVALILSIPLIAMQFTNEVNWSFFDFVIAAGLLLGTGFLLDFVWRKISQSKYRIVIGLGIVATLILIWAELAVGIFGTPLAGS